MLQSGTSEYEKVKRIVEQWENDELVSGVGRECDARANNINRDIAMWLRGMGIKSLDPAEAYRHVSRLAEALDNEHRCCSVVAGSGLIQMQREICHAMARKLERLLA